MRRRALPLLLLAAPVSRLAVPASLLAVPAWLLAVPASLLAVPALARSPRGIWFDPAQLPSFTGRLERWLMNPAGETDRALLREGTQVILPPSEAAELTGAINVGDTITVWGVRARAAPVITMLAWAKAEADPANFVGQPAWFASTRRGTGNIRVAGSVDRALLTPQGEPMGVLLKEGAVLRLGVGQHAGLAARLAAGVALVAEGPGTRRGEDIAIDAIRLGPDADHLADVAPEPAP